MTSYVALMDFLAPVRSGMALATEKRLNVMAEELESVTVLTLNFQRDHDEVVDSLRAMGRLHDKVAVINFHDHYRALADAAVTNPSADLDVPTVTATPDQLLLDEPGLLRFPDRQRDGDSFRYYDDAGRYVKYKRFDRTGLLEFVDHQSSNLQRTHRIDYDASGRPVREVRFHAQTNRPTFERYLDSRGACYLSSWVNGAGRRTKSVLHTTGTAHEDLSELQITWATDWLAGGENTVLMLDELLLLPVFRALPAERRMVTIHNSHLDAPHTKGSPLRSHYRDLFKVIDIFDAVVFLTEEQRTDIEELYGPHDSFTVIPHGLSPAQETEPVVAVPRRAHAAITLARLEDSKNIADAIRAFRIVVDEVPDARYDIFGYGSQREPLQTLIAELDLVGHVMINDFVEDVDTELRRHACLVSTSRYEGFGLAILEALGSQTPVVAYRTKYGPSDLVEHGRSGYLVEFDNYRQIAAYLLQIFTEPGLQEQLADGCRSVQDRFSSELFRQRWLALLQHLAGAPARRNAPRLRLAPAEVVPVSGGPVIRAARLGPDLDEVGRRLGIDQASDQHDYLQTYQDELDGIELQSLVIVAGHLPDRVGRTFAESYPHVTIHLLSVQPDTPVVELPNVRQAYCPTVTDLTRYLLTIPAPDAIIEDGATASSYRVRCFRSLFLHLRDGGLYAAEGLPAHQPERNRDEDEGVWEYLDKLLGVQRSADPSQLHGIHRDDVERAKAMARVTNYGKLVIVKRRGDHLVKVRDDVTTEVLNHRLGADRTEEIEHRVGLSVESKASLWVSRERTPSRFHLGADIPDLHSRIYREVVVAPRQLVLVDDVLPPIAFHHPWLHRLKNRTTLDVGPDIAQLRKPMAPPRRLSGSFYHLDSEFPGHFGHFMTEDLGRLWGWPAAKQRFPDLKLLLSADQRGGRPPTYALRLLQAFGIPAGDIVCIDRPVQVQTLIGASPMYHNGKYVHPELPELWSAIGSTLVPEPGQVRRKLFISRAPDLQRACHNAAEVEALFSHYGFQIVLPEQLPIEQQARLFAEARIVAGFGGSGMFTSIFAPPGVRIVLGSESHNATNEWLIAGAQGGEYHHFYGRSDIAQPTDGWTVEAFHSPFTIDLGRWGGTLKRLLKRL